MGKLSEIAKELYDDGFKEGKCDCIRKILLKSIDNRPNEDVEALLDDVSVEKLDRICEEIFDIKSWEDVEEILRH